MRRLFSAMSSDREIAHLWPAFADKFSAILVGMQKFLDVHHPGHSCKLVEGLRSASYQHSLYEQGRGHPGPIVTYKDGYRNKSNHQTGMAADIGIFDAHGAYLGDWPSDIENYYGHLVRAQGLTWGGAWKMHDTPHAEWNTDDHVSYHDAALWLNAHGLSN